MSKNVIEKQEFYCKKCKKTILLENQELYYNYKCPDCMLIINKKDFTGMLFKNCPTVKNVSCQR